MIKIRVIIYRRRLTVATRNVADFAGFGARLFDPFDG